MKAQLERVRDTVIRLQDLAHDDEITDELGNALIHLDAAIDRLIQIDEDEDED